jgi:hypothetical protein
MNTTRILNIIFKRIFSPDVKIPLGRWKIHNEKETSIKIKYANEDNSGLCYHNCKNITKYTKIYQNNDLTDDEKYIYMMGYESVHTQTNV